MNSLLDMNILGDAVHSLEFITTLLQASTEFSIIGRGMDGNIILWNEGSHRIFGYSGEEVVSKENADILHTEHDLQTGLPNKIQKMALETGRWEGNIEFVRKDGTLFLAFTVINPLYDSQKQQRGYLLISRDITEKQQLEKLQQQNIQLKQDTDTKSKFLSNISHELRTPLNAIIGFTGTLLMKLPGPLNQEQEYQLTTIKRSGQLLLTLINDLVDLAKIEANKINIKLESINCHDLINELVKILSPLAITKHLVLETKLTENPIMVYSDKRILLQILLNLGNNAIKFTDTGSITVALKQHKVNGEPGIAIHIIDSGIGITESDQELLFNAFVQLSADRQNGSGLGLHISKLLAGLLHAQILVKSDVGKGSDFTLILPVSGLGTNENTSTHH